MHEPRHWLEYAGVALAGWAAIAASIAAGFGGWQAWIARDTAERQLRAYVYLGTTIDAELQHNPDGSSTLTVNLPFKVFGVTPAAWVSPAWDLKLFPAWARGQFPQLPVTAGRTDVMATPAQDYRIESKRLRLKQSDLEAIINKAKRVVAFGWISYDDIFGKSRWTDFCASFDLEGSTINSAELCPSHNDADWSAGPPPLVAS